MWLQRSLTRLRFFHAAALLTFVLGGCGTSREYVGTSDEVWNATLSAIRKEYRNGEVFPDRWSEGPGEFFIPVRVDDNVDRAQGRITLDMGGVFFVSESAADITMRPIAANFPVAHRINVRVWYRGWYPGSSKFSSEADEQNLLSAIDRAWNQRNAATRPAAEPANALDRLASRR